MKYFLFLVSIVLGISPVFAADVKHKEIITLEQAIERVLEKNPQLKAAEYDMRAAEARIGKARPGPPYQVNIDVENFTGTGAADGGDLTEATLSLSRVLEIGDKPTLRGSIAQQEAHLLGDQQAAIRLDLLAETVKRFVDLVTDQERLTIAQNSLEIAQQTRKVVERRVKAGKAPLSERNRATINLAQAELELEHAEHELAASRINLSTLWGEIKPNFKPSMIGFYEVDEIEDFKIYEGLLERNPDLVRFVTAKRLAEARMRLAQAGRKPNIELSGGLRYLNQTDDATFIVSASIPLGSGRRAEPSIQEAENLRQREPLNYEQRRLELYSTLFGIYQELKHAQSAVEMLSQRVIREAELAYQDYEKGYETGRYSFLELTEAQRLLLDLRLELVTAANNFHRYRIEIERLTGGIIPEGVTP